MANPNTDPELLPSALPADAEPPVAGSAALLAELAELAAARAKADEHWDQLLRARAELDNLRKRQALELEKAHKYALDSFVRELLPVQDSLELGHDAAQDEGTDLARLREGTAMTLKLLSDAMARFGVVPVEPLGEPFNPEFHQAMTMQPRDDVAPNTVTTVMQKGYTLNGRLVRPALVMVSRAA
ncbi:nucleotide exchange factor GrpE [uncultured Lamprocystis sp.]|jgi:molecular chaperone GrpE|uniref:nucleotide exchange factor GrpE n=1 Tax=uncultured Lamprocystis sp. TaxID=543132 RepID=UPI0025CC6290|nr:nucleotide exchange factor GrpE [uncultured Lamprocystis sp.]